ncbi:hypothetical protein [Metaclostridioides mangenotii]|uniref:hypothetical protein n=1 Tax=Metaclostridioides mangenotii TaxID=1540 RepID=UPI0004B78948|nr:hypothetical protein [Clostridioides mangenotii]
MHLNIYVSSDGTKETKRDYILGYSSKINEECKGRKLYKEGADEKLETSFKIFKII